MNDFDNRRLDQGQYFVGTKNEIHEEYDLKDPNQRPGGIRVALSLFLPVLIFGGAAAYFIVTEASIFIPVILVFVGVSVGMIATMNAVIYNKEHGVGNTDPSELQSAYEIRSLMIIIVCCITYIPFLCYIVSLIFAKKYPNCGFYQKGEMNAQVFTLIWSLISLFAVGLLGFLYFAGIL